MEHVYVDPVMNCHRTRHWQWTQVSHLVGDTERELHAFAALLGLHHSWFQQKPGGIPHYDLTPNKRAEAVKRGAKEISRRAMIKRLGEIRRSG